jgi:MFS transporter, DHA1 family, multidrug resistance protein
MSVPSSPRLADADLATGRAAMAPNLIVLILSLCLGIQPITTDLYLPALPALTQGFGATMGQAQLTLSALLLSFGLSQLIWGPLSDRFGRRPILLSGLLAYTLAAVASTLSPSMDWLIGLRVVQGAAMGAVVMCARAIVRDLYQPGEGARIMSKGLSGLGVLACISAPVGGLLAQVFGWPGALMAPAVFAGLTLGLIALRFQESLHLKNPDALRPATLVRTWGVIFKSPAFRAYSALSVASYGGLFTFLATSSFVFIQVLGLSKTQYGLVMLSMSFAYLIGTFLCRRLLLRFGVRKAVAIAGGLSLTGGTLMALFAWAGFQSVWSIMAPFYLFTLAHGVHQPCGQSGAVTPFPQAAGAASAMNGFLMMVAAFAMGGWLGTRMDGTVFPLTHGVWFWSMLIAAVAWTAVRQHGEPAHEANRKA